MEAKEKKNNTHVAVEVILLAIILGLGVYIASSKELILTKEKITGKSNEQQEEKVKNTESVAKIYSDKEYIYDAEYEKNVNKESYSTGNKTYYAKDIVVPFININSSYVTDANNEIKTVFDQAITAYNDETKYVDQCNYTKYIDDKTLSVILTYGEGATDVIHPKYYTYNINLKDGNKLTYSDVCNLLGLENVDSKVEAAVTTAMKEKLQDFSAQNYEDGTNFDTYNNQSINNYKESVTNNTIKYFITENKKLNVIVKLSIPAGTGEFDIIISVN